MSDNDNRFTEPHSPGELLGELDSLKALLDEGHESVIPYTSVNEISSVEDYLQLKQQAESAGMGIEDYLHQQTELQPTEDTVDELELLDDDEAIPLMDEVYLVEEQNEEAGDELLREVAEEEQRHTPSTDKATTVEDYFAAVAAAKRPAEVAKAKPPVLDEGVATTSHDETLPVLDEIVSHDGAIPVLEEVFNTDETIPVLDEVATDRVSGTEEVMSLDEMQQLVDLIVSRKLEHIKTDLEKEVMGELQKLLPLSTYTKS